jgi:hypothetical protein
MFGVLISWLPKRLPDAIAVKLTVVTRDSPFSEEFGHA